MKSVLAFGDSNTWGMIPGTMPQQRYPRSVRWTGVLEELCGDIHVIEEGLCGRTTVYEDAIRPGRKGYDAIPRVMRDSGEVSAAVIMLGTNDCKTVYNASAGVIGKGAEACVRRLMRHIAPENILLVSPIYLGENVWKPEKDPEFGRRSVGVCRELREVYSGIASCLGTAFLAASDYASADSADDEHMDEAGHRSLAAAISSKLREMGVV